MNEGRKFGSTNPRNYIDGPQAEIVGEQKTVALEKVRPNAYNYNAQSAETFNKLIESMRVFGFVQPIICRDIGGGVYEIINGEHRWRAGKELGLKQVPIIDLGQIKDADAKQLAIVLNELGGSPDQVRLADLLRDISTDVKFDDLAKVMPFSEKELSVYIESVDFSFSKLSSEDTRTPAEVATDTAALTDIDPAHPADEHDEGDGHTKTKRVTLQLPPDRADALSKELARIDPDPAVAVEKAVASYIAARDSKPQTARKTRVKKEPTDERAADSDHATPGD